MAETSERGGYSRPELDPVFDELREEYESGRLIVFAGAGVSTAAGLPSWKHLVETLLARARAGNVDPHVIADIDELVARQSYIDALSALKDCLGPAEFCMLVERQLDDKLAVEPHVARAIAELAPRLRAVVTTNLDHLLEKAFGGRWPAIARASGDLATREKYILKLHGTLLERDTWVLTREQYDRAMWADVKLSQTFTALFHTHALLFIGYGLADDDFDAILARVRAFAGEQPPRHFALAPAASVTPMKRKRLQSAGVRVLTYANHDGAHGDVISALEELRVPRLGAPASTVSTSQTQRSLASPAVGSPSTRPLPRADSSAPPPTVPEASKAVEAPSLGLPRLPAGPVSVPASSQGERTSASLPGVLTPSAPPPPLSRVPGWVRLLAAAALGAAGTLAFKGAGAGPAPVPRDIKIGMSWLPFASNEDKNNPLVKLITDGMKCDAASVHSPVNVQADFGASYDKLVLALLAGEYSFAFVPPFTYMQCLQGKTSDYAAGQCPKLELNAEQRALLPHCRVVGQKLRFASGVGQLEQQSYQAVLLAKHNATDLVPKGATDEGSAAPANPETATVNWQGLNHKTVVLGNALSTSSNIIPRILLAENGVTDVNWQPDCDHACAIQELQRDDQGKVVVFMAEDDYQREGLSASDFRVFPLHRRIPFDPAISCREGSPEEAATREQVIERMTKVGLVRPNKDWNYPMFERYVYTAPVNAATLAGRTLFTLPPEFMDRRGLHAALRPGSRVKVLRFDEADATAKDVIGERTVGVAKIEKVEGDRGEVTLTADIARACALPRGACHLDVDR